MRCINLRFTYLLYLLITPCQSKAPARLRFCDVLLLLQLLFPSVNRLASAPVYHPRANLERAHHARGR